MQSPPFLLYASVYLFDKTLGLHASVRDLSCTKDTPDFFCIDLKSYVTKIIIIHCVVSRKNHT